MGLVNAIDRIPAFRGSTTNVIAIDTFNEHRSFGGIFTKPMTWLPPSGLSLAAMREVPQPLAYYQFLQNVRTILSSAIQRVVPFPLLAHDAVARARALGANGQPFFIYVNPPAITKWLSQDLPVLWRLLACGGTIAGAGYHLPGLQPEIDTFAANTEGVLLERFVVHAPGTKWEKTNTPFSHEALIANKKSNISYWRIRNKPCTELQ